MAAKHHTDTEHPPQAPVWGLADLLCLLSLFIIACGLLWRLWTPGVQSKADMLMGVYRIFELAAAWREGIFYPRIGPHLNFSYGSPLFQFYPPLASYIGLLFNGLGLGYISAAKAVFAVGLMAGGWGMYELGRTLFGSRSAAWLSALSYMAAPYLLLDVYERGAAAEVVALGITPWLFWAARGSLLTRQPSYIWFTAATTAGLMVAHNITALFVLPAVISYVALLALYTGNLQRLGAVAAATALGLGMAAFYWLPAVWEIRATHAEEFMLGDASDVTQQLRTWQDLFQSSLIVDYFGPARFRFALVPALFAALGLLTLPWQRGRVRFEITVLAAGLLGVLFLQTEPALWFWQHAPLVRFIQFSWRLYGLASLSAALILGALLLLFPRAPGVRWAAAIALAALVLWTSMLRLDPALSPVWYDIGEGDIQLNDLYARGRDGFPLFADYLPLAMQTSPFMLALPRPPDSSERLSPVTSPTQLRVTHENPVRIQLAVETTEPTTVRFHRVFFPGWQVDVDGRPVPTYASSKLGHVTVELPEGNHTVIAHFGQTPIRRLGDGLSWLSLAIMGAGLTGSFRRRRTWVIGGGLLILLGATALYSQGPAKVMRTPTAVSVNFQNELHLLGYDLEKTTWRPGELLQFRLHWFVQTGPKVGYRFFVHLAELDDSGKAAQIDTGALHDFNTTTRWEAGEVLADSFHLPLEPTIRPGSYRLLVGVYHPETVENLRVVDSSISVLPGDRLLLAEVVVADE